MRLIVADYVSTPEIFGLSAVIDALKYINLVALYWTLICTFVDGSSYLDILTVLYMQDH